MNQDQPAGVEKRRASRHAIEVEASLRPSDGAEPIPVTTLNISEAGVYLGSDGPTGLAVGDQVSCDFKLPPVTDAALSSWGIGRIVRVDNCGMALELTAGIFNPAADVPDADTPAANAVRNDA